MIIFTAAGDFQSSGVNRNVLGFLLELAFFCELPSDGLAVPMEIDLANERTPGDGSE